MRKSYLLPFLLTAGLLASLAFTPSSNTSAQTSDSLCILTWNVFMRPRWMFHNDQIHRAKSIADCLKNSTSDILVLQELFDHKARRMIQNELKAHYPYAAGPGPEGWLKLNSGVMILSKLPIKRSETRKFAPCAREDCLAKKSGIFAEIIAGKHRVQIFGTHLQAIDGDRYNRIRQAQMRLLSDFADEKMEENVIQIFAGDMNTDTRDTAEYQSMLRIFRSSDGAASGEVQHTSRGEENDILPAVPNSNPGIIDFVLLRSKLKGVRIGSRKIIRHKAILPSGKSDLSDHYGVEALLIMGEEE